MEYKKLIIRGISYSQTQSGAYALLLEQPDSGIKLPIVIGNFEAQSISIGLEKDLKTPRPLTHDLFSKFIEEAHYIVESVIIYKFVDGVFFANINFTNRILGNSITLDSRTSDAVAMAVRFDAPIWDNDEPSSSQQKSIEELHEELNNAVRNEDFDLAQKIQKEIKSRNKKID